ncbi:TOBE domain-containing protein [Fulvivirgaceae bacterium BMA10]|uniref:TOBE domain-containing protein n=1 Tax=Splendidivirga corallicola TaxID=3051826 RepID=A0ABT8KHB7_9BACT|nr:TOBE domain-containing protein [Fulvivirgaceae bacterium BMA10]
MNILKGEITEIESQGNLSLVKIQVGQTVLKSIVIETPATSNYLTRGNPVNVLFKETEVVIGKDINGHISLQNQLLCTINAIEKGKLLSKLTLEYNSEKIISIITTGAVDQLSLQKGDTVMAMVKTNEIMLST